MFDRNPLVTHALKSVGFTHSLFGGVTSRDQKNEKLACTHVRLPRNVIEHEIH
ncbi:unnamed protein product, partial [Dovyalis caffra]